jgi:hypothetical protein
MVSEKNLMILLKVKTKQPCRRFINTSNNNFDSEQCTAENEELNLAAIITVEV